MHGLLCIELRPAFGPNVCYMSGWFVLDHLLGWGPESGLGEAKSGSQSSFLFPAFTHKGLESFMRHGVDGT